MLLAIAWCPRPVPPFRRAKQPGSPALAGSPSLIDQLMREMVGGAAWPAGQGAAHTLPDIRPRIEDEAVHAMGLD